MKDEKLKLAQAIKKKKEKAQLEALNREERLQQNLLDQLEQLKNVVQDSRPDLTPLIEAFELATDKTDVKNLYEKVDKLLIDLNNKEPIKITETKIIQQKPPIVNLKTPDHKKELQSVIVNLEQLRKEFKEEAEKKGQRPEDYIPTRRVRKDGNRLIFDDDYWTGSSGGGSNTVVTEAWLISSYPNQKDTVQTVKATAGTFGGYLVYNPNTAVMYLQVFDTSGAVTLGTTVPKFFFGIPSEAAAHIEFSNGITMDNAIKIACTTTANGSTAPTTGLDLAILYR